MFINRLESIGISGRYYAVVTEHVEVAYIYSHLYLFKGKLALSKALKPEKATRTKASILSFF